MSAKHSIYAVIVVTSWLVGPVRAEQAQPAKETPPAAAPAAETAPPAETVPPAETAPTAEATPAPEAKPLPGPKYFNLRYDEDFSYLDGEPGSFQPDFFDPIKNIRLGDDLRLSVGGEFRFRLEAETNKDFDTSIRSQDTFQLYRYMLHFDFKYRKLARVFIQGISAFDEDRNLAKRAIDENQWDVHQLFADVRPLGENVPLTVRVGRQELQYGKQRLVSPPDWPNVRRRFDAVKVFWTDKDWSFDVWYAKPVVVKRQQGDDWDEEYDFYGAYFTYVGIPKHGVDLYFFASDNTGDRANPNGNTGDESRYTLGSRFWGETGPWDYEAELAGQWGHWAGDTVQAWNWTVGGGYTFAELPWKPRLGTGFDWASGDEHPNDGKVGTFDQLFPAGHVYFGYLDLVGRQNITAANVELSAWPVAKKVKAAAAYHAFWLNAHRDALYSAAGTAGRRDPLGGAGEELGHELDLTVVWNVDVHSSLLFGYSHFWDSSFVTATGRSEDPDLLYVQYQFRF